MFKRIILGAFTFWVGLTATIVVPNVSVNKGFKQQHAIIGIERARAEAPTEKCTSLVANAKERIAAVQKIRSIDQRVSQEVTESIDLGIGDVMSADEAGTLPTGIINSTEELEGAVKTLLEINIRNGASRLRSQINTDRQQIEPIFELVKQSGSVCPLDTYTSLRTQYQSIITPYNKHLAKGFPPDFQALVEEAGQHVSKLPLSKVPLPVREAMMAGFNALAAADGGKFTYTYATASFTELPTDPKKIDPNLTPSTGNGSTKPTAIDPSATPTGTGSESVNTPVGNGDPCGCAAATNVSKAPSGLFDFAGKVFWDTLALFCGLGCLALSSMVQLYLKAYVLADCVRLGFPATIPECNFFGPPTTTTPDTSGSVDTGDIVPPPVGTSKTDSIINESGAVGTSPEDLNNQELTNDTILLKP